MLGHSLITAEVIHQSGAPSTALRLSDGERTFAYSGDTEWTDALLPIANAADLFICECYAYAGKLTGHMSWEILQTKILGLAAKRLMVTHMNPTMLARLDEIKAAGVLVAHDGLVWLEFLSGPVQLPRKQVRGRLHRAADYCHTRMICPLSE